jgi:GTP cyclohydrolase I
MLDARGAAVRLHAFHSCTRMRGVCENDAWTSTLAWRGDYESSEGLRREFLALASRG